MSVEHRIESGECFVFGSNRAGHHGRGAALDAVLLYGAVRGVGEGRAGRSYAIPTKDERIRTLQLSEIAPAVARFLDYARANPGERFFVTAIGTGLAGYSAEEIAPMFAGAPDNCRLPPGWRGMAEAAPVDTGRQAR